MKQFDFGQNWSDFSRNALDSEQVEQAKEDFKQLTKEIDLANKSFIDIGFGQGLGLLTATTLGAKTFGCDINIKCKQTLERNKQLFPEIANTKIPIVVGSILENKVIEEIKEKKENYDVVHSWGVLHHTGEMWKAITNSVNLVAENGHFILAIYNKHWSSKAWVQIKRIFVYSPKFIQTLLTYLFFPIIFLAKFLVTGKNPLKKERGMNFFYDVIDWVGGYPYEYASKEEIITFMKKRGFTCLKTIDPNAPTGCNQFVFQKK